MSEVYHLYRKDNDNGTSKDWGIAKSPVSNDEIYVRHCSTGMTARLRVIPSDSASISRDISERITQKLKSNYVYLGDAVISSNRFKLTEESNNASQDKFIYYREKKKSNDAVKLKTILAEAVSLVDLFSFKGDADSVMVESLGSTDWQFEFDAQSYLTSDVMLSGVVDTRTCGVMPLLLLLYVNSKHPLHFADSKGKQVELKITLSSEWFVDLTYSYAEIKDKAVQLGLLIGSNDYKAIKGHSSSVGQSTFWF